ncbi:hypothetical protein J2Y45_002311 [Dyadobacter sp. BE34]|uniref:Beta-lactamase-inhibitor-like PepSY-like domain-containing protein n=1 Tax=Dyadobacter fermentans TaxID=94254 RepID=A0ABU1QW59_9BACT|nr:MULTISPECIES: hypothetical protein [Dyadobacter]MDR6805380.1 hypothetical protein [Dyadobacter fermentans]MDR7042860.1 hypothetical protein [Dyadobacter sp. BE242]MDR7197172.1 hypothetical protein [Dyadobacter sp. BE34]MDR7215393.1 hypothetical protein [Dyadobacter sp. BE31]MDR7262929.1 hypothetical protein [Dyadobacter sp. BE32]
MKTFITSAIIAALAITGAQAQTLAKDIKKEHRAEKHAAARQEVSARSKDSFYADFGQVPDAKWVRGPQFDEVTFTKDGQQQTAYYDNHFMLVGTTADKKFSDVPAKAQKEIQKQFKGYAIGAVVEYKDNENNDTNMLLYGTQFEDADHYFVTVSKGKEADVLMVKTDGEISFFSTLRK